MASKLRTIALERDRRRQLGVSPAMCVRVWHSDIAADGPAARRYLIPLASAVSALAGGETVGGTCDAIRQRLEGGEVLSSRVARYEMVGL